MSKRTATTKPLGRPPKKIKAEETEVPFLKTSILRNNAVLDKVKLLVSAFDDEEQVGLLSISNEARDLLQSTVASVLGEGSASDQRHPYQTRMANAIGSTLAESVKVGDDKVSGAKEALKTSQVGHKEAVDAQAAAKSSLEARVQAVKSKKEQLDKSSPAVNEEEQKVAAGEKEVEKFAAQLQKRRDERDKFKAVITDTYDVLKAYEWESDAAKKKGEKKLLTALESALKKLKADSSMFVAIRNALSKPGADRSQFDLMAMDQVEQKLNGHLQGLEELLAEAEKTNAEKVGVCAEAAAALEGAQKYKADCKQEHDAAKAAKMEADAALRAAREDLEAAEVNLAESQSALEAQERLSTRTKETIDAFTFLYERRINPESAPCTSPCKVAVKKVEEPAKQEEEAPARMEVDATSEEQGAVEPVCRDSPAKIPTLPEAAVGTTEGSPAKGSASPAKVTSPTASVAARSSVSPAPAMTAASPLPAKTATPSPAKAMEEPATAFEEAETQEDEAPEDQMTDELPTSAPMEDEL